MNIIYILSLCLLSKMKLPGCLSNQNAMENALREMLEFGSVTKCLWQTEPLDFGHCVQNNKPLKSVA